MSFRLSRLKTVAFRLALADFALEVCAAQFPLPIPTRPTSFPLSSPPPIGVPLAWGDNEVGQTDIPASANAVAAISGSYSDSAALKGDGTVVVLGYDPFGRIKIPADLTNAVAVAVGRLLALRSDGTVTSLALPNKFSANVPHGLTGVVAISTGGGFAVALKADGTVVAWGDDNTYQVLNVPAGLSDVVAISASTYQTLALKGDGTVVAWGSNLWGQLNVPSDLTGVVAVTAGDGHSVALKRDGTLVAWGYNVNGEINIPAGLSNVVAISAGLNHTIALKSDGTVAAWGFNGYGQLNTPANLGIVTAIAAGGEHTMVLLDPASATKSATGIAQVTNGSVVSINLTYGGSGYTNAPAVHILGGGGSGALAQSVINDGYVSAIQMISAGSGYTGIPTIQIAPPYLPPDPRLSITVSPANVIMKLTRGFTYQVEASQDLSVWLPVGAPFVANAEFITQEFVLADSGRYFRVRPVQ